MNTERTPNNMSAPDSSQIECQVVGELISAPEYIPIARDIISPAMFQSKVYGELWKVMLDKDFGHCPIDIITLRPFMEQETLMKLVSSQTTNGPASMLSVREHCAILRDCFIRRSVFLCAVKMLESASDNRSNVAELMAIPGALSERIGKGLAMGRNTQSVTSVFNELAEDIERIQDEKSSGKATRVPTGFKFLDYLTYSGFNEGQLIILSARPSVGKTALMIQFAKTAVLAGVPTTIYSLEMTNKQVAQRLLFSTELVSPVEVASGDVEWNDFERANKVFDNLPLFLNDSASTLDEITADIIASNQQKKCGLACIDYLGLIETDKKLTAYQSAGLITKRMKQLAKQCRIPILLLCQLNRRTEAEDRSPELYDLRDSGSIEQDADIVLMLERESHDLSDHNVNLWVRKNRQGRAGEVMVKLKANSTFTDFEERRE